MPQELTEKQRVYLRLVFIEGDTHEVAAQKMCVDKSELGGLWEEIKEERLRLKPIRDLWSRKCKGVPFEEFEAAYLNTKPHCHYCGIKPDQIQLLWEKYPYLTKRGRGKKLELQRLEPNEKYSNLGNLVFSCYWCNNAKTDTFSEAEFKKIGEVIRGIWEERLGKISTEQI